MTANGDGRRTPATVAGESQRAAARSRFLGEYLKFIRGNPTPEDIREAGRAFETWWTTGIAGGKYVPVPEETR